MNVIYHPFFQNPWEIDLSPNDPFQSVQETKAQNHQEQQYKEGHQVIAPNFETEQQVAKNGTSKKTKHINQVLHMFNYLEPKWPMFWMEFGPSFGEFKAQNRGRSQVPNICQGWAPCGVKSMLCSLQGTNMSQQRKRKIIFKVAIWLDILVPRRVQCA